MALSNKKDYSLNDENRVLFEACEQGDLTTLQRRLHSLLPSDIKTIRDQQQATLVHYAARYGHLHILQYLIESKNVDISQLRTEHGASCVHDAAVCDQVEVLRYILHYVRSSNRRTKDSLQKIHWTVRDEQGNTPLHLAAAYGSIKTLHYLLNIESADPHVKSYNGFQPIHYAASSGHGKCVRVLLTVAPDTVNVQTSSLLTPIYLSCQYGFLETTKILSSFGANFRLRDENGLNCLHTACQNAHIDIVQWLVETQGADVNDVDYLNNTPLHYAAGAGSEAIIMFLLDNDARITAANNGNTPLHVAAENGHHGACALLIERGRCSVSLRNSSKLTSAELANNYGFPALAHELRLQENTTLTSHPNPSTTSQKIRLENATVVRLVVKKRNVERSDASNQVDESDLVTDFNDDVNSYINAGSYSSKKLTNQRFDFSELRARVEEHEATKINFITNGDHLTDDVLMHSMDSLNQQSRHRRRSKLPTQTYAPWLKTGAMTPKTFEQEIQRVGSNLRKVRRNSLEGITNTNSQSQFERSRESPSSEQSAMLFNKQISSSSSHLNDRNDLAYKRSASQIPRTTHVPKAHQFITASPRLDAQSNQPEWRRALNERRRTTTVE